MYIMNWQEIGRRTVPTTTEEFYEVLKAFKTQDPNGNGKAFRILDLMCREDFTITSRWGKQGAIIRVMASYKPVKRQFLPPPSGLPYAVHKACEVVHYTLF